MQYLERFYKIQKNLCTIMYIKIFLFSRNHSIYQPKINLYELGCAPSVTSIYLSKQFSESWSWQFQQS